MSREYASPELSNLIAARLSPEEFERRVRIPLSDTEAQEIAELIDWFSRRYPTAKERLAYARRKFHQYTRALPALAGAPDYGATAERLPPAPPEAHPPNIFVLPHPDPHQHA